MKRQYLFLQLCGVIVYKLVEAVADGRENRVWREGCAMANYIGVEI